MFCYKCGSKLVEGAVYCSNCGIKVGGDISFTNNAEKQNQISLPVQDNIYALTEETDAIEKKPSLKERILSKVYAVFGFIAMLIGIGIVKSLGKEMMRDSTVAYILLALFSGAIGAWISYYLLGHFEYFKDRERTRIGFSVCVWLVGVIGGAVAAGAGIIIVFVIGAAINDNHK